jgi:hypothetical protein
MIETNPRGGNYQKRRLDLCQAPPWIRDKRLEEFHSHTIYVSS